MKMLWYGMVWNNFKEGVGKFWNVLFPNTGMDLWLLLQHHLYPALQLPGALHLVHSYHIVHTVFDDWIPFCEFFTFLYAVSSIHDPGCIYFIFLNKNKHEYLHQLAFGLSDGNDCFPDCFLCLSKCSAHTSNRIST